MANILYGVSGEGSGHSTRAKEVIRHLQARGHRVRIVSFDRGLENLRQTFEVTEIYGLRLAYVNNRVRYGRTLRRNLLSSPQAAAGLRRLIRRAQEWNIQLVITDFEPLSCRVAHHLRLPLIAIDNQHCLTRARVSYPRRYAGDAALVKLVTQWMTPHSDFCFVLSFFPAEIKRHYANRTFLSAPILRREVLEARSEPGEHLLAYVTSPAPHIARLLAQLPLPVIAYGFVREGRQGNIEFRKPSLDTFLGDLAGAQAVIANAGFSLVSEALFLGKPYLALPVRHQFEQGFNAYYIQKMGYGRFTEKLCAADLANFLAALPEYRRNLVRYPRHDNSALLARLDSVIADLLPHSASAVSAH
jgi:uncharacterized protein (TIGR00661 family)